MTIVGEERTCAVCSHNDSRACLWHVQISEEVEALFNVLPAWAEQGRKEAVQVDTALQAKVIAELIPSIAAVRNIAPREYSLLTSINILPAHLCLSLSSQSRT